jgi:hypothetical protein
MRSESLRRADANNEFQIPAITSDSNYDQFARDLRPPSASVDLVRGPDTPNDASPAVQSSAAEHSTPDDVLHFGDIRHSTQHAIMANLATKRLQP